MFHGDGVTIIINISMKGDEELVILSEDRKNWYNSDYQFNKHI